MTAEERIQDQEILHHTNEHQESGVHCDFWIQLLASWKSLKDKSTLINYPQRKKYVSFAKLLNGKTKQRRVAVLAGKLCLHCYMILLKRSNSCLKTYCFSQGKVLPQQHLQKILGLTRNWQTPE
jgi:hypothetical protein